MNDNQLNLPLWPNSAKSDVKCSGFLEDLLEHAIARNWCVKMNCTTCGANQFRNAIKEKLRSAKEPVVSLDLSIDEQFFLSRDDGYEIVVELRCLDPICVENKERWEKAVMLLLLLSWNAIGELEAREVLPDFLLATFAGEVLAKMILHSGGR